MRRIVSLGPGVPPVCRLGLATWDGSKLAAEDVRHALDRGLNYFNWCGHPDGMSRAIASLGAVRDRVAIAVQIGGRTAAEATAELEDALRELKTDRVDVATFYYVESEREWAEVAGDGGVLGALLRARREGKVRLLGLTSHQRKLAARIAAGELAGPEAAGVPPVDLLMIRYNAAHRGAEEDVFPVTDRLGVKVVSFTAQRWGALNGATPADPPGLARPAPREWYRFALSNSSVAVTLSAPGNRTELDHNLGLLDDWRPIRDAERASLAAHGDRVRAHAGRFD